MASAAVPLPPRGYKADPKPPPHYVMNPDAPISPDLEDRRNLPSTPPPAPPPTFHDKLAGWKNDAKEEWAAIKREPWFQGEPPIDTAFYAPGKDASSQIIPPKKK